MVLRGVVAAETISVLLMKHFLIVPCLRHRAPHRCGDPDPFRTTGMPSMSNSFRDVLSPRFSCFIAYHTAPCANVSCPKKKTSQHKNTFVNDWRVHSYGSLLRLSMWAHQHMRTTSLERFQGRLQRMSSQESIAPTKLSTLLWHQIMFKPAANKRSFLTSLVAGHTQSFESFLVIVTVWRGRVRYLGPHIAFDGRWRCKTSRRVQAARNMVLVVQVVLREDSIVTLAPCCFLCNGGWCGCLWLGCFLPRQRLKRTKWTSVCWHSDAKLSEVTPRISTATCA